LFLKECEFRFNYGTPKEQLATLRRWVVSEAYLGQPLGYSMTSLRSSRSTA
jgi:hypothetical protein